MSLKKRSAAELTVPNGAQTNLTTVSSEVSLASRSSQVELVKDRRETVSFQRELTLLHALAYVVGTIIGSGIFISPKGILQETGAVGTTLIIWAVCGLIATLGALSFSELALTIPKAGGQYIYMKEIYGDVVAFFSLWTKTLIQGPAARAIQSLTFASYAVQPFYGEECDVVVQAEKMIGAAMLLFLVYLNTRGTKLGAWFQVLSTAGKVIALVIIIIVGVIYLARGNLDSFQDSFASSTKDVGSLALAFYPGLYAYSGYTAIVYGLTEMKKPERTLPLAIIGGLGLTIILYLLTNVSYLAVMAPEEVVSVDAVALTFGTKTLGMFYWVFSVFVCISVTGTLNSTIFASCRMYHSAAKQGQMIPLLAMMNVERLTPMPALVFGAVLALVYLIIGDIYVLINTLGFVASTENFLLISGLVYWRFRKPELKRPVKYPVIIHILFALSCLFLLAFPLYRNYREFGIGIGIMSTSLIVYYIFLYERNASRLPSWLHRAHEGLTNASQKLLYSVYEEEYKEEPENEGDSEDGTKIGEEEMGDFVNGQVKSAMI